MRRFLFENSLSIFFLVITLATIVLQSIAGHRVFNEEATAHGSETIPYARYLLSSHFGQALLENWQSEYLQFALFALATVWLVQKGSNESKELESVGLESEQKQKIGAYAASGASSWARARGWRTWLYSNSLVLGMAAILLASWCA